MNIARPTISGSRIGRALLDLFDAALALVVIGMTAFSIGLLFARLHWMIDNAASFELLYLAVALLLAILTAIRRKRIVFGIAAIVAVYHVCLIVPYFGILPQVKVMGTRFRIMSANLQWDSPHPHRIYEVIRQESPDILALQEVTPERVKELEQLRQDYPYWAQCVGENLLGIALLSKMPLSNTDRHWVTHGIYPTLIADAEVKGIRMSILLTHTIPPFSADWVRHRDAQLTEIGERALELDEPCIVVGDLNATMWTPSFGDLVETAQLANARSGFGVLPTYSIGPLRLVPIDHVLFRGELSTVNCRVGTDTGSDHRPLIVDMMLR